MKTILLSFLVLLGGANVFGQSLTKNSLKPAPSNELLTKSNRSALDNGAPKTLSCTDTIRYPQIKEQILGASNFYLFDLWADDNESMSQAFLLSGSTIAVNGVEFLGRRSPSGAASVSVRASIYNVDANNNPTTEAAFGTITITDTTFTYRQVNFTPVNVSANYAVVIRPTSAGGIVEFYVNNAATGQTYDENLSRAKSDWYTSSSGSWVNIPTYTVSGFTGGPYDFEMLAAPKITYTLNTDFTVSPEPSCLGTPVTLTNTSTPSGVINSRFYTYQEFRNYFQSIPDSTHVYDLGGTLPLVWSGTTTHTYATAGTHSPTLYTNGGFWNSCFDSNTETVTVNPLPTVTASATSTSVCAGSQVTLTGGGASTYSWNNGVSNGVAFTPTATTTYTVTGTSAANCQNTAQVTVTVNPIPTVTASATSTTVCAGTPVTLTGGGASTYSWNNGVSNGVAFTPTTTTTYTVTGTSAANCQNTAQVTVTVNALPTVTASASTSTLCAGGQVTLTGGGAVSYTWNNGATNGVAFTPTATTTYTVTGTGANNCQNTAQTTVTVNPLPTVTANATATGICTGDQVTLTGGGAVSYTWNNGVTNGVPFSPSATTTYTVTGTDANNCQNTAQVTVSVATALTVTANATSTAVCAGDQVTLTGGGASSYTWDNGVVNGVAFTPTATTTYNVSGTSGSCSGTDQITITVNPLPTVTASTSAATVCSGNPVTLTGGGAASYTWNNGVTDGVAFSPTSTTTYTVTGTNANNCQNTAQVTVTVNPLPSVTANTTASTACNGDQVTLTGGGAVSYTWNNGVTNGVAFVPTATNTYTVTGTDGNNCVNTAQVTVTVNTVDVTTSISGITLTANNANGTYQWINCDNNQPVAGAISQSFTPVMDGNYGVVVTENGCSDTSACQVIVVSGVNEVGANHNMSVYPNPVRNEFTLSSSDDLSGAVVKIYAVTGQILLQKTIVSGSAATFNTSEYASGLYFVEINQNGSVSTLKVVKE